jgi:hypothetical protein
VWLLAAIAGKLSDPEGIEAVPRRTNPGERFCPLVGRSSLFGVAVYLPVGAMRGRIALP